MSLTTRVREIPPEMLLDIAAGMEDPPDIALRYGFTASEFARITETQEFLREINIQRAENDKTGVTARNKAGMMYDILAEKYFQRLLGGDVAIGQLAAGVEAFATLGGKKPKATIAEAAGAGFQIVFNIQQPAAPMKTILSTKAKESIIAGSMFGGGDVTDVDSITLDDDEA